MIDPRTPVIVGTFQITQQDRDTEPVAALIVAVSGALDRSGARDALAAELIAYCREHLASLKCPRSVDFRRELPRHPTGKLLKRQLRDEYWGGRGDIIVHRTET